MVIEPVMGSTPASITTGQDVEVPLRFVDDAGVEPVVGSITIRVSPKKKA